MEGAQPTIVFDVKDGSERDLSSVAVSIDDHPLADKLDGRALPVDPGEHVFVFTVPRQTPVRHIFVLKEGEKERRERIMIGSLPPSAASPEIALPPVPPARVDGSGDRSGAQKPFGLLAGVVGIVGISLGSIFGLKTIAEKNRQQADCASPTLCTNRLQAVSDHSNGMTDGTISTVGFVAGSVLLAGGAFLFFTVGHSAASSAPTGVLLVPSVGSDGGEFSFGGKF